MSDLVKIIEALEEISSYQCILRSERLSNAVATAIMELMSLVADQDDLK